MRRFTTFHYRLIPLYILLVCGAIACRKVPKFSETPNISFLGVTKTRYFDDLIQVYADSVIVGITVQDGNGDVGVPKDQRIDTEFDYFVNLFRKTNGVFLPVVLTGVNYNGHLPLLLPVSTPGPIEGKVYYKMTFSYSFGQSPNDTLKFMVRIKDRAGNFSNTVETPPVIIRQTP